MKVGGIDTSRIEAMVAQLKAAGETVMRIGEIRARQEGQAQTIVL